MDLRKTALSKAELKREPIDIPEWGDGFYIRVMSAGERDAMEASAVDGDAASLLQSHWRSKLVMYTLCDDQGNRIFTDGDLDLICGMDGNLIARIAGESMALNQIAADAVSELEKN